VKKGIRWAGVQRQYSGTAGADRELPDRRVFAYVSAEGHALIDRGLYLPESWTDDRDGAWYAHITLSMLALAWLAGTKALAAKVESASTTRT
jgi:SRSO17 transposase